MREFRTAGDLFANANYQRAMADAQIEEDLQAQQDREMEAPLLADLGEVGIEVGSVFDLLPLPARRYEAAIPVLHSHLLRDYDEGTIEGIARALAVPEASAVFDDLLAIYLRERSKGIGRSERIAQASAVALSQTVSFERQSDYLELFRAPEDDLRLLLLSGLGRLGTPEARDTLDRMAKVAAFRKEAKRLLRSFS